MAASLSSCLPNYLGFRIVASLASHVKSQAGSEIRLAKMGRNGPTCARKPARESRRRELA